MDNDEKIKLRVKSLLVSKQLVTSALIVLIGGVAGLFFITGHIIVRCIFIITGILYAGILGKEFYKISEELKDYLYKK